MINRTIAIYPGRFQPWHLGHGFIYKSLTEKFGVENVWVTVMRDGQKSDPAKNPFTAIEKVELIELGGVPASQVIHTDGNVYKPSSLFESPYIDTSSTAMVIGCGDNKKIENPRNITDTSYFQNYADNKKTMNCMEKHAYNLYIPMRKFYFRHGKVWVTSATVIRETYKKYIDENDDRMKIEFLTFLYGFWSPKLQSIFDTALTR